MKRQTVEIDPLGSSISIKSNDNTLLSSTKTSESNLVDSYVNSTNESKKSNKTIDPFDEMVNRFLSLCRTTPMDVSSITFTVSGIQLFARSHAWRQVVESSNSLISKDQLGLTGGVLTLVMKLRLEGLFRLKMFDELIVEASKILQTEENRLSEIVDTHPSDPIDCDLLIAMKLLLCEIKALTGQSEEALEQLYILLHTLQSTNLSYLISNALFWTWRVRSAIVNASTRQRQWRVALTELLAMATDISTCLSECKQWKLDRKLDSQLDDELDKQISRLINEFSKAYIVLLCRLSRAYLQIGNITASIAYCDQATNEVDKLSSQIDGTFHEVSCQVNLTRGLTRFSLNKYDEAMDLFSQLITIESQKQKTEIISAHNFFASTLSSNQSTNNLNSYSINNSTIDSSSYQTKNISTFLSNYLSISQSLSSSMLVEVEDSLFSIAINNYSICALNMRKVKDAISKLEELIQDDPARHLNDAIVFNLCTLYDLTCSPDLGQKKKRVLHTIAKLFHVNEPVINWKSFRLS
uniref:Uncharacterized protein n=1 Tax=Chromulina nebulosa TaxID=96789 RepID=A0A7S0SYE5_9STRA|mmetsp:Transcript_5157/g.4647  ORF Transcript_5157/g.4647 Transcript_5157/m.4647 type:complete len:524 (+) Transcript_5157:16-1587(+)